MPTSTLTSKGQITVPKPIRDRLNLKVGERLHFSLDHRGGIKVRRVHSSKADGLAGLLRHLTRKPPVSLAEMKNAVQQRAARKYAGFKKR